jgi:hypothetical protein
MTAALLDIAESFRSGHEELCALSGLPMGIRWSRSPNVAATRRYGSSSGIPTCLAASLSCPSNTAK